MAAYYNEFDPYAAEWLRNLIKNGLIAEGDVDERSILDVAAAELRGYTQCHFFAGIGVWSYALRLAGWPDDRPVWTGSCPCQPFSVAGKGKGFDDDRHLWPVFHRLIAECRPAVVFGEQVASKDGLQWLDAVCADMEASGYAIGAADLCAAGVGAPHIRQRLWFVAEAVADAECRKRGSGSLRRLRQADGAESSGASAEFAGSRDDGGMADAGCSFGQRWQNASGCTQADARQRDEGTGDNQPRGGAGGLGHHHHAGLEGQRSGHQAEGGWIGAAGSVAEAGEPRGVGNANCSGGATWVSEPGGAGSGPEQFMDTGQCCRLADASHTGWPEGRAIAGGRQATGCGADRRPSPTDRHWRDADWLHCRDGKWRPVEPGTFPLAHGASARVGRLRAYGNAIVPQVAAEVIGAYLAT